MSTIIPQRDLRNRNAQIIERVRDGESFTVTRDGVPVADVTPHKPSHRPPRFRPAAEASPTTSLSPAQIEAWSADVRELREIVDDGQHDRWGEKDRKTAGHGQ